MKRRSISALNGFGMPLAGHDIDTDRIYPARFLRTLSFEGIEEHLFRDDRADCPSDSPHPFDDPRFGQATVLIVNRNFGCGSSREHAPQALYRWGIRGLIGESFADIFADNARRLGMVCVALSHHDVQELADAVDDCPTTPLHVDIAGLVVRTGSASYAATMSPTTRKMLLGGLWDTTALLAEAPEAVREVASSLPYVRGFDDP